MPPLSGDVEVFANGTIDTTGEASVLITTGVVFRSDEEIRMPYRLQGSNPDAIPATIRTALDQQAWRIGTDLRVASANGLEFRFTYAGEFGDKIDNHTAGLNVRMAF